MKIPIAGPSITEKEIAYVTEAVKTAWYENAGCFTKRFEQAFADYIGVPYAISLPSATSGLHLSLAALGIGPGDEVIVPDITWIATAAPIDYVGATAVFADIHPKHWCIDAERLEQYITAKTKAIICVDLYGNMPDYEKVQAIADKHNLSVIEDAAQAIGSTYKSQKAGCLGKTGVFSFHASKTITTGEGGMVVTADKALYDRMLMLRDHGRAPGDRWFNNETIGFKYKMSELQAALGLAQLERIDEIVQTRRDIFQCYQELLAPIDGIQLNQSNNDVENSYWMVTAVFDQKYALQKQDIMQKLQDLGIDSRPFFHPLSSIPAYKDTFQSKAAMQKNTHAYAISPYAINLPTASCLSIEQIETVCKAVFEIVGEGKLQNAVEI